MDCEKENGPDKDETKDFKLEPEMKELGTTFTGTEDEGRKNDLPPGKPHHDEVNKDSGAGEPTPSGGPGGAWVEFEKYEEVRTKLEHHQKLLSEANRKLEGKEEENKKLQGRLARIRKAYPDLERMLRMMSKLKREANATSKLVEDLMPTIDPIVEEILRKEEEVSRLTRRINKLKLSNPDPMEMAQAQDQVTEGKDAVSIFPEEVWRMILGNLTDHKDRWNCSNTCSLFKRILRDWKLPTSLFHKVFPYLFQQLPQNRILELRLVSKGWGRVVDQYMEKQPSLQEPDRKSMPLPLLLDPPMQQKKFYTLNKFNFTNQEISWDPEEPGFPYVPDRNPFIGRVVTITFNPLLVMNKADENSLEDYGGFGVDDEEGHMDLDEQSPWDNIYSFLRKFGKYIWELTIDSSDEEQPDEAVYYFHSRPAVYDDKMFQFMTVDLASLVPNLRKLRILPCADDRDEDTRHYDLADSFEIWPNLESVEVIPPDFGLRVVPGLILKHHSSLKALHLIPAQTGMLHLTGNLWEKVWQGGLDWPNLTELHLDHIQYPEQLQMLFSTNMEGCSPCTWSYSLGSAGMPNLRKLGINLRGMEKGLDFLLLAIHKLFSTTQLSTLRVCGGLGSWDMFQELWWPYCMSPTLKTLEVEHGQGEGFYNFLSNFPFVENVNVFSRNARDPESAPPAGPYAEEGEQDVHDYIEDGRMYESSIWELLPRLKVFTFKWDKFTRAGYEKYLETAVHSESEYSESLDDNDNSETD